jgi:hypothetical protein
VVKNKGSIDMQDSLDNGWLSGQYDDDAYDRLREKLKDNRRRSDRQNRNRKYYDDSEQG